MRKSAIALLGALFAVALGTSAFEKTNVTGVLIDMACYAHNKENVGNRHKDETQGYICAQACALEGFPVGLLTTDGKVYQVMGDLAANSNAKLVPHMAQTVTLTGEVSEQDGNMVIVAGDLKVVTP